MAKPTPAKKLILTKDIATINFIITTFGILGKKESNIELISEGSKVFIVEKEGDTVKLGANTPELRKKIFGWLDDKPNPYLYLSEEETSLLKQCADAAFYFLTEDERKDRRNEKYIWYYTMNFKN